MQGACGSITIILQCTESGRAHFILMGTGCRWYKFKNVSAIGQFMQGVWRHPVHFNGRGNTRHTKVCMGDLNSPV